MKNKTDPRGHLPAAILLIVFGLLAGRAGPALAQERAIVLGRSDGWQDLLARSRVEAVCGRYGDLDLVLQEAEYAYDGDTDLLLHFNGPPGGRAQEAGSYRVLADGSLACTQVRRFGAASAGFQRNGLVLTPGPRSLLRRGSRWSDFSIELWVYPLLLTDGEVLLSWSGSAGRGRSVAPQRLLASLRGRRLEWSLRNLFADAEGRLLEEVTLAGITPLLPRAWHHHLLRFDGEQGLLEYLVDGIPEAVTYTTSSGRQGGAVHLPGVGEAGPSTLAIGEGFTGFLDELRLSRRFVETPTLTPYPALTGQAVSRVLDLGYTGTRLRRIEAVRRAPANSAVDFHYRLADSYRPEWERELEGSWVPFVPDRDLDGEPRGRFLQLMVELFPDGSGWQTPEVSELAVVYEPDLPPAPPADLQAVAGDGQVTLIWKRVNEPDVRGYRLYYGPAPGNYHGEGAAAGPSPVDVGDVTRFTLTGLENSRLYYFTVVSYDGADPPHLSAFCRETSARPSGLFR